VIHAVDLVGSGGGFGYLLKDRVLDVDEFLEAIERVSKGGSALDPKSSSTCSHLPRPTTRLPSSLHASARCSG
jgi:DNA-binding NarL/FixJ family response regulator